jgi:hypothetical protein
MAATGTPQTGSIRLEDIVLLIIRRLQQDDMPGDEGMITIGTWTVWYRDRVPHRDGDLPAIVCDGTQIWCRDGIPHRCLAPAFIGWGNTQRWWIASQDVTDDVDAWIADGNAPADWTQWTDVQQVHFLLRFAE